MKITPEKWMSLSSQQKERKVFLFPSASTGNGLCRSRSSHSSSTCTTSQHVPPSEMQDEEPTKEDHDSESPVMEKPNSSTSGNLTIAAQMGMLSPQVGNQGPMEGTTNGQDTALCISGV